MQAASWNFDSFLLKTRSLGQWAAKLLADKVEVLKKKSATSAIPPELCASVIGLGSSSSGVE